MSEDKNIIKEAENSDININTKPKSSLPSGRKKRRFSILFLLNGEFLQRDYFLRNLPYFLFVAVILAVYIANAYYAENKIREITQTEEQIKELHAEFISLQAELTEKRKEYQVSKTLIPTGMQISDSIPPRVINVSTADYNKIY
jgi:hypothetical protein